MAGGSKINLQGDVSELDLLNTLMDAISNSGAPDPEDITFKPSSVSLNQNVSSAELARTIGGSDRNIPTKISPNEQYAKLRGDLDVAIGNVRSGISEYDAQNAQIHADFKETLQALVDSFYTRGEADSKKLLLEGQIATERALEHSIRLSQLGINSSDANSLEARILVGMKNATEEKLLLQQEIEAKNQTSFLENPIGFIINQFELPSLVQKHNAAIDRFNAGKVALDKMASTEKALDEVNQNKNATLVSQAASAAAESAKQRATESALLVKEKASQISEHFVNQSLQSKIRLADTISSALTALQNSQVKEDKDKARELEKLQETTELGIINDSLKLVGAKPIGSVQEYNKLPVKLRAAVEKIRQSGGNNLGDNPMDAAALVRQFNTGAAPLSTKTLLEFEQEIEQQAETRLLKRVEFKNAPVAKQKKDLSDEVERGFADLQLHTEKNLISNRDANPYRSSLDAVLQHPDFKDTKLAASLKAAQASGLPINDQKVIALASEELIGGKTYTKLEQAAKDLHQYFLSAMAVNNGTYNWEAWGLRPQRIYGIGGKDYGNYSNVAAALVGYVAKGRMNQVLQEKNLPSFQQFMQQRNEAANQPASTE